jgi:hypothetical protein
MRASSMRAWGMNVRLHWQHTDADRNAVALDYLRPRLLDHSVPRFSTAKPSIGIQTMPAATSSRLILAIHATAMTARRVVTGG